MMKYVYIYILYRHIIYYIILYIYYIIYIILYIYILYYVLYIIYYILYIIYYILYYIHINWTYIPGSSSSETMSIRLRLKMGYTTQNGNVNENIMKTPPALPKISQVYEPLLHQGYVTSR